MPQSIDVTHISFSICFLFLSLNLWDQEIYKDRVTATVLEVKTIQDQGIDRFWVLQCLRLFFQDGASLLCLLMGTNALFTHGRGLGGTELLSGALLQGVFHPQWGAPHDCHLLFMLSHWWMSLRNRFGGTHSIIESPCYCIHFLRQSLELT